MKICNTCNFTNEDNSYICGNCGATLDNQGYQNNNFGSGMNNFGSGSVGAAKYAPLSIASISTAGGTLIFTCCCAPIAIIAGIAALVLGFLGKKQIDESNGALKGKELCMVGMIAGPILAFIAILLLLVWFFARSSSYYNPWYY